MFEIIMCNKLIKMTLFLQTLCVLTPCLNGGTCLPNYKYRTSFCLCNEGFVGEFCEIGNYYNPQTPQGRSQDFSKGVHSRDTIRGSPTIYDLYRCSPSCISGLSRIIVA